MNEFVDNALEFINENTTLLIIICVFLIFVLVLYLINSSVQAKKLEKQKLKELTSETNEIKNENIVLDTDISKQEEVNIEQTAESNESQVEEPQEYTPIEDIITDTFPVENEVPIETTNEESIEPQAENENYVNSINVEPEVNDILLKDFSSNENIVNVETNMENKEDVQINPIENNVELNPIENNYVELVKEEEKSQSSFYKNDKKITDIFSKKKEEKSESIEENEIDRILAKINELQTSSSEDSTLEETQEFNNMF